MIPAGMFDANRADMSPTDPYNEAIMAGRTRKTYEPEIFKALQKEFAEAPEVPPGERPATAAELVEGLRDGIRAMKAKGYTLEQIIERFQAKGVEPPVRAVKAALSDASRPKRTRRKAAASE